MHSLIRRQIKSYLKDTASLPEEFQEFIKAVDKAYHENDADRLMLERAFDLSSQELIQVNEELKESEEKYRLIAENTADLITVTDVNLRFTYISPSIMLTHGYTVEEAMNMTLEQFMTPESMQNLLTVFEEEMKLEASGTADPGRIRILEVEEYKKDGSIICLESSISAERDKENKPIRILTVNRDITDRKRAEKKLRSSEEKFRMLAESSPLGIMMHQGDRWIYANRAAVEISGYTEEELYSMDFWDIVHPDYRDMVKKRGHNRQQGKALPRDYEFKIIAKNGLEKWVILTGNPIKYEDKPTAVISVTDITERKIIEAALMESEIKYRRIFESFEDLYYQTDEKGIIRVLSPSLYRLTGWSPDELIGKPVTNVYVSPKDQGGLSAEISQSGFLRDYEVFLKKKDGTQAYASLTASILTDPDGRPCGIAGTLRDITERKQAEKERKQSFERLRKALGATVQSISMTVEMKDPYTAGHQQRVSDLARAIATEMGLSADRRDFIRTASSIHDIGKVSVPAEILSKPTKLTGLEFSLIKTHSQSGYDILKDIEFPWPVADVVLQHHERMDGSGYPQGLKGNDILLEARIMAVADVVEAIASHRPYRPSRGIDFALDEISRNKGILYDADVVDACLKLFQEKSYTLLVLKN